MNIAQMKGKTARTGDLLVDQELGVMVECRTFSVHELEVMAADDGNWRPQNPKVVRTYLESMRSGEWVEGSGEPLIVDKDGRLVDGAHRAAACAAYQRETGRHLRWLVVHVEDRARAEAVNDTGSMRTFMQWLNKNAADQTKAWRIAASTITRRLWAASMSSSVYEITVGHVTQHITNKDRENAPTADRHGNRSHTVTPSANELIQSFEKGREAVYRWCEHALRWQHATPRLGNAFTVASTCAAAEPWMRSGKAVEFAEAMHGWKRLRDDHPCAQLAQLLVNQAATRHKRSTTGICAVTVKALNAFAEERRVKAIRWALTEAFPTMGTRDDG